MVTAGASTKLLGRARWLACQIQDRHSFPSQCRHIECKTHQSELAEPPQDVF